MVGFLRWSSPFGDLHLSDSLLDRTRDIAGSPGFFCFFATELLGDSGFRPLPLGKSNNKNNKRDNMARKQKNNSYLCKLHI